MPNRRQGMILYGLWLSKEDAEGMEEIILDETYLRRLGQLVRKARIKGDFNKR